MRSLVLLSLAAALALAPVASAQVPVPGGPAPVYTVEITNAPTDLAGLAANTSAQAPFSIVLTLGNVVCTAAVNIPVTLTATAQGAPSNVAFTVEPAVVNFTVDAGPHGSAPAGSPAGGTADAMLVGAVTGNITANATVQITLSAVAPAPPGPPEGCQGASGNIPQATSAPVLVNATLAATPQPPVVEPPSEDTPFVGLVAVLGVAAAVALARRRKA